MRPGRWRSMVWPMAGKETPILCTVQQPTSGWPIRATVAQPLLRQRGTAPRIIPTYEYEFQRVSPGEAKGATHSAELPYVFGYYPKSGQFEAAAKFVDADFKLADEMETYWTNFAKTGNPNSDALPHWPGFEQGQAFIEFTRDGGHCERRGTAHAAMQPI